MISTRLQKILEWTNGKVVADIGCDHAYIACYAAANHQVEKAYACDVAQGPLNHAKETIADMHLEGKVIPKLMWGIKDLPEDVDQIVVAGMGAELICKILDEGKERIQKQHRFLISCHKDPELLRSYLSEHGFSIEKERIIQEDQHFYPLMEVRIKNQLLSPAEIYYGKNVVPEASYRNYLRFEKIKWRKILEKIPAQKNQAVLKRLELLDSLLND